MKKSVLIFLLSCTYFCLLHAQSYDEDRVALSNFVERFYNNNPFEGCRIIDDYNHSYLISVVALDPSLYKGKTAMNRVAQVKSLRNSGEFLSGTQTFSEFTIQTPKSKELGESKDVSSLIEVIRSNSSGFVQQLQVLTTFSDKEKYVIYVFYKLIH